MARRFPLQSLLDLARDQSDDAAQKLQSLKVIWQSAEDKLAQLQEYREEYRRRLQESTRQGMQASSWREFQLFLDKLDGAIKFQADEVAACEHRWGEARVEWLEQQRKLKAFDTLSHRHRRSEEKREAKVEQRELDEFAGKTVKPEASEAKDS